MSKSNAHRLSMHAVRINRSLLVVGPLMTLAACAGNAMGQASLLAWWKLDETSLLVASDSTGNGHNGDLTNMVGTQWTSDGQDVGGLDFAGDNDYIETNTASNLTTNITMMAWFKSDDLGSIGNNYVTQRLVTQRRSSTSSRLGLGFNNNNVALYWYDGSHRIMEGATAVSAGVWYHAAVTYDSANVRLYINGVEDANSPWAEASMNAPSTNTFQIGAHYAGTRLFDGVIDDVRIYDEARTADEVDAIYHLTAGVNYRSIGTDAGTVYGDGVGEGNATVAAGSKTVTFAGGASLPANVGQGDTLTIGADTYSIVSKDSATQVTLHAHSANPHTTTAYTITRAYTTLSAWETARQADLVANNTREVGVAYNDGPFSTILNISGSTTDANHYVTLTVEESQRHDGTAGTGVVLDMGGASANVPLQTYDAYTKIEWFEVTDSDKAGATVKMAATQCEVSNLIVHDVIKWGIVAWDSGTTTIRNCLVYDATEVGILIYKGTTTVDNCTVDGTGSIAGIYFLNTAGVTDVTIRNTIAVGAPLDFAAWAAGVTVSYYGYNMYATSDANFDPEAYNDNNQTPPADLDDLFISTTSVPPDYNLEWDGHEAWDNGLDLSSTFTTDIIDTSRTVPWEMGAYEITGVVNRRSIGTTATTLHSTGNASITQDKKIVTFSSATLPTTIGEGDELVINGETFYIYRRDSSSQVTTQAAAASTHSNLTYTIKRAFNSPQAWEDDLQGDLVTDHRREVGVGYNDGAFASVVTLLGSDTDALHYLKLTVADGHRHNGIAGSGVRIDAGGGLGGVGIRVREPYTIIDGWELTGFLDFESVNPVSGDYTVIENLLIHDFAVWGIFTNETGIIIRNCIIYDGPTATHGIYLFGVDTTVENCTINGVGGVGVSQLGANTAVIRNTISVGNGTDFDCAGTLTFFGNNMFETTANFDPDAQDGGNVSPPAGLEDLFVSLTPGSEDLHLEWEGHEALLTGLDLSSSFTTDIDGDNRIAPWDMGADRVMPSNYRSIGTTAGTIYGTGTATIGVGASVVTFAGATLPANIGCGDKLTIDAEELYILSRDSDTQVSVQGVAATAHAGDTYTIARVYNTLQAWEDARSGDLVTAEVREIGVCYNDSAFTSRLVVSGSTTNQDYFMMVTVADGQRHTGLPSTGAAIDNGGFSGQNAIDIEDEYTRIQWLEIRNDVDGGHAIFFDDSPAADNGLVSNVFVHSYVQSSNSGVEIGAQNVTVRNSFFDGGTSYGVHVLATGIATIENCTIYGDPVAGIGVGSETGSAVTVRNTISVNHTAGGDFVLDDADITFFGNNMFSTTSGLTLPQDGGHQWPPQNLKHLFVSTSTPDLHLRDSGQYASNAGLDLSADFSRDIDDATRTDTWDMGADEGVTGTILLDPKVLTWTEIEPQ